MEKIEKYVVSRDLSEKLKTAGYSQKTQFAFMAMLRPDGSRAPEMLNEVKYQTQPEKEGFTVVTVCAAPLSDELLEQLPAKYVLRDGDDYFLQIRKLGDDSGYSASLYLTSNLVGRRFEADKPADALAELYCWCVEQGYIK
jgi:hypothetical protein